MRRYLERWAFAAWMAVFLAGCSASNLDKARQVTTSSLKVLVDGSESINAADAKIKDDLIAKVKSGQLSYEEGQGQFDLWVQKRTKVVKALTLLWDSIKTAVHVIDAVDAQHAGNTGSAIADVGAAVSQLIAALAEAGVSMPGLVK